MAQLSRAPSCMGEPIPTFFYIYIASRNGRLLGLRQFCVNPLSTIGTNAQE